MLAAALAQARDAERRVALLEARLDRAGERALRAAAERDAARRAGSRSPAAKPKVVRERVVDDAALARAQRRAVAAEAKAEVTIRDVRAKCAEARMDAAEARTAAKRMAAKLERAEATIGTLRGERRELKAGRDRLSDELVVAERLLERAQCEAQREPTAVPAAGAERAPDAAQLHAARVAAARDRRAAADAELRAARAERELRETVAVLRGEARRLTPAELAALRTAGPSGPAVMAAALQALTEARRTNNPMRMQEALRRVAQAAVTWQERI